MRTPPKNRKRSSEQVLFVFRQRIPISIGFLAHASGKQAKVRANFAKKSV